MKKGKITYTEVGDRIEFKNPIMKLKYGWLLHLKDDQCLEVIRKDKPHTRSSSCLEPLKPSIPEVQLPRVEVPYPPA